MSEPKVDPAVIAGWSALADWLEGSGQFGHLVPLANFLNSANEELHQVARGKPVGKKLAGPVSKLGKAQEGAEKARAAVKVAEANATAERVRAWDKVGSAGAPSVATADAKLERARDSLRVSERSLRVARRKAWSAVGEGLGATALPAEGGTS